MSHFAPFQQITCKYIEVSVNKIQNIKQLPLKGLIGLILSALSINLFAAQPKNWADVVGANECSECHEKTTEIWQQSHHFSTFTDLPRSKEAKEIGDKMGIKRIKSESLCLNCHFTQQEKNDKVTAIAGISCESCHSPAKNWLERHSEFSGKEEGEESKAEIAQRWKDSEAAGMIRPKMLYTLAKNCYSCHITPNEKLVNQGGHSPGSEFELLSWSQGEVRHNVWHSKGEKNREATQERKRMMFVVGAAVELEESLRAVGEATSNDKYAKTMAKRAALAAKRMAAISKLLSVEELNQIIGVVKTVKLSLNQGAALNTAADKIGSLTQAFVDKYDGATFSAIDQILPSKDAYKGKIIQ